MKIRITFQNDRPASDKQVEYISKLIVRIQAQSLNETNEKVNEIIGALEMPKNLTSWEASGIIDMMRDSNPDRLARDLVDALEEKLSGKKVTSANINLGLLAFTKAMNVINSMRK